MDALQLESDIEIKQLSILDITGKLVKQFEKPATIISVGDMPIGIYIVKIVLKNEEVYFTRITKQ